MRNAGLENSNYCMTVVGVAPPLCVTQNFIWHSRSLYTVYNGAEELLRTFCWHSGLFRWMTDDQLTNPCNDRE